VGFSPSEYVRRTRRNHAIEHATIHVLAARRPGLRMAGRSDAGGFVLYGNVATDDLRAAAEEAVARLDDEPSLAVHPHCGTNTVVTGLLSGFVAFLVTMALTRGRRSADPFTALPRLLTAGVLSAAVGQPLGPWAQQHLTTLSAVRGARIAGVEEVGRPGRPLHRVRVTEAT